MAPPTATSLELCDRLLLAAQFHAREAVTLAGKDWTFTNALDVAYRSGAAVELLTKKLLAQRDMRLLARAAHEHLLDAVSGGPVRAEHLKTTLDAKVAVSLAAQAEAGIAVREKGARDVLLVRNAAVHLAAAPPESQVQIVVAEMVATVEAVLAVEAVSSSEFWGEQHDAAMKIVRRYAASVAVGARTAVNKARQVYRQTISGIPADSQESVVEVLQSRALVLTHRFADEMAGIVCPACGHEASAFYDFEVDVEDDHGEPIYHSGFLLAGLACPVCGLHLDGEEAEALDLDDLPSGAEIADAVGERDAEDRYEPE
ncbi:hypothetical protein ABE437_04825 [Isoptericola cucumis]|uniref:hypothetical protein n=1 Tax=Isoptericola cucumis TaxID=1776856 RepID=UPI0032093434